MLLLTPTCSDLACILKAGVPDCRFTLDYLFGVRYAAGDMQLRLEAHHQHLLEGADAPRPGAKGRAPPPGVDWQKGGPPGAKEPDRWARASAAGPPAGLPGNCLYLLLARLRCMCCSAMQVLRRNPEVTFCPGCKQQ